MDGWELLRQLRHDVLLQDIPVVVLSWREDFLQRLRELDADADEYMKKELDRNQILLKISSVLAARFHIERRLADQPTFAGRVEAVGIVPLLLALSHTDGHRRLAVREAWNLFELVFSGGRLVEVRNSTSKGWTTTGTDALAVLLGTRRGRFTVSPAAPVERSDLAGDLDRLLADAAKPVQAMVAAIDRGAIVRVARVHLRRDRLAEYLELVPADVRHVIGRLGAGESPRELILSGEFSPQELERVVLDLVRRGNVERIEAPSPDAPVSPSAGDEERWAVLGGDLARPIDVSVRDEDPLLAVRSPPPSPASGGPLDAPAPPPGRRRRWWRSR